MKGLLCTLWLWSKLPSPHMKPIPTLHSYNKYNLRGDHTWMFESQFCLWETNMAGNSQSKQTKHNGSLVDWPPGHVKRLDNLFAQPCLSPGDKTDFQTFSCGHPHSHRIQSNPFTLWDPLSILRFWYIYCIIGFVYKNWVDLRWTNNTNLCFFIHKNIWKKRFSCSPSEISGPCMFLLHILKE